MKKLSSTAVAIVFSTICVGVSADLDPGECPQQGGDQCVLDPSVSIPVPATLALFGLGLAGLGWSRRKKA